MADCREGLINPSGEIEDSSAYNLNFSQINERGVVAYPYMNVLPLLRSFLNNLSLELGLGSLKFIKLEFLTLFILSFVNHGRQTLTRSDLLVLFESLGLIFDCRCIMKGNVPNNLKINYQSVVT